MYKFVYIHLMNFTRKIDDAKSMGPLPIDSSHWVAVAEADAAHGFENPAELSMAKEALRAPSFHALAEELDASSDRPRHHDVNYAATVVVVVVVVVAAGSTYGAGDAARKPDNSIRATTLVVVAECRHVDSRTPGRKGEVVAERIRCCHLHGIAPGHGPAAGQHEPCWPCWLLLVRQRAGVSTYCGDFETRF